jgi:hypothetical protein
MGLSCCLRVFAAATIVFLMLLVTVFVLASFSATD